MGTSLVAKGLDVPLMADRPDADLLWFVGCAGSFDDRGKKISRALTRVLRRAGVDSIEHGLFLPEDDLAQLGARGGGWVPTVAAMETA